MRLPVTVLSVLTVGAAAAVAIVGARGGAQPMPLRSGPPVLVELYQSQGCSSCPPAEANLNALADRSDVIALSFAVTYWDYLGWRDSFAKPQFTQRQWDYARFNHQDTVATPQVWVNGRATLVGGDRAQLEASIRSAKYSGPTLAVKDGKAVVGAGAALSQGADLWVATYDPRTIQVAIGAGENGGRTLPHRNIVTQLSRIGHWSGPAASFALPHAPNGMRNAIFLQAGRGGPIIAAAKS